MIAYSIGLLLFGLFVGFQAGAMYGERAGRNLERHEIRERGLANADRWRRNVEEIREISCPMGGPRCDPEICDCFIDSCQGCASGTCPTGGIHPETFEIGENA